MNQALHHLTSCINPHNRLSAHDEARLLKGIIDDSFQHGFDGWVGHAIAAAAGNTICAGKRATAGRRHAAF
jgi:hypothetical protein